MLITLCWVSGTDTMHSSIYGYRVCIHNVYTVLDSYRWYTTGAIIHEHIHVITQDVTARAYTNRDIMTGSVKKIPSRLTYTLRLQNYIMHILLYIAAIQIASLTLSILYLFASPRSRPISVPMYQPLKGIAGNSIPPTSRPTFDTAGSAYQRRPNASNQSYLCVCVCVCVHVFFITRQ